MSTFTPGIPSFHYLALFLQLLPPFLLEFQLALQVSVLGRHGLLVLGQLLHLTLQVRQFSHKFFDTKGLGTRIISSKTCKCIFSSSLSAEYGKGVYLLIVFLLVLLLQLFHLPQF